MLGHENFDENLTIPSAGKATGMDPLKTKLALLSGVDIFGNSAPFLGNSSRDHNIRVEDI